MFIFAQFGVPILTFKLFQNYSKPPRHLRPLENDKNDSLFLEYGEGINSNIL